MLDDGREEENARGARRLPLDALRDHACAHRDTRTLAPGSSGGKFKDAVTPDDDATRSICYFLTR